MKKFLILTVAAALSASSAIAGSLAGAAEEADPFVAQDDPKGSGISPLLIGLGAAAVVGGIILIADSGSSSAGTTAP